MHLDGLWGPSWGGALIWPIQSSVSTHLLRDPGSWYIIVITIVITIIVVVITVEVALFHARMFGESVSS